MRKLAISMLIGSLSFLLGGCVSHERDSAYEGVAKEWSKAIRASQVIPTYPLTEDLQPGDMFIVDVPVDTEQELWDARGYLPLGYHFGRLAVDQKLYASFYDNDFGLVDKGRPPPPLYRQSTKEVPGSAAAVPATARSGSGDESQRVLGNWDVAPFASFPSYSVEISRQSGFNIGLPVEGVPVALGLLGSSRATASISLKDAYTYGVDSQTVWNALRTAYAQTTGPRGTPPLSEQLRPFEPRYLPSGNGPDTVRYRFLRVVTRVYLIGAIDVSIIDHSDFASDLGLGTSGLKSNLQLLSQLGDNSKTYTDLLGALNNGLNPNTAQAKQTGDGSAPSVASSGATATTPSATTPASPTASTDSATGLGARLKVMSVSDKSISMRERFMKPLVVGYIAYDIPIGVNGQLSKRRVDTFKRLSLMNRQSLGDAGESVQDWMVLHSDGFETLEDWGKANAKWLSLCGFTEFAVTDGHGSYKYRAGSLPGHFLKGKLLRFAYRTRRFLQNFTGDLQTHWRSLYDRLANEIVYAPDGVIDELFPESKDWTIYNQSTRAAWDENWRSYNRRAFFRSVSPFELQSASRSITSPATQPAQPDGPAIQTKTIAPKLMP